MLENQPILSDGSVWVFCVPKIKIYLKGYHFEQLEDIQSNAVAVLKRFFGKKNFQE
jgi:hypothetical protein